MDRNLKAHRNWWCRIAVLLTCCATVAFGQAGVPALIANVEDGVPAAVATSTEANSIQPAAQDGPVPASAQPGNILGTVLDQTGSVAMGAVVHLTSDDKSYSQEVVSGENGQFSFSNVPAGTFKISVDAEGFGNQEFVGELASGQTYLVPPLVISIATVVTDVKVSVDPVEVATEEVKLQEQQRVFGFIPNFYVSYNKDAVPLTPKLKFQLAWKSSTDPITIAGTAFLAGLQQAADQYPEFGQGAQGYAKRLGAGYADVFASTFLSGAVFPTLLKQDPRYYYQGTGSTRSRIVHAVGNSVMCKGDNGRWQVNYSNLAGVFGGAALSSTFYPTNNVGMFTLSNGFIRLGESSLAGVLQEFVLRKLTKTKKKASGGSGSSQTDAALGSSPSPTPAVESPSSKKKP